MNQKIFSFLIVVLTLSVGLQAQQSLQITFQDTLVEGNAWVDGDLAGYAVVKNISNLPVEVAFKRIDENYTELTDSNAICWGLCFTTNISQNPVSFNRTIQPGATDTAIVHVYPDLDGYTRDGFIDYVLFDYYNPTDSVAFRINFKVNGQPLSQEELAGPSLSVYPNPVRDLLKVNYDLAFGEEAQFELINLVGSKVLSQTLDATKNYTEVDLSALRSGVYLYTLRVNGNLEISKKLVIE